MDVLQTLAPGAVLDGLASLVSRLHTNMGPDSDCTGTHDNVLLFGTDVLDDGAQVHFYAGRQGKAVMAGRLYSVWGSHDRRLGRQRARYHDEFHRTMDGWRIANRRYASYFVDEDKAGLRRGEPQDAGSGA